MSFCTDPVFGTNILQRILKGITTASHFVIRGIKPLQYMHANNSHFLPPYKYNTTPSVTRSISKLQKEFKLHKVGRKTKCVKITVLQLGPGTKYTASIH